MSESQLGSQLESKVESLMESQADSKKEIKYINEILESITNIKKVYDIESVKDPLVSELINIVTGIENKLLNYIVVRIKSLEKRQQLAYMIDKIHKKVSNHYSLTEDSEDSD